jgi:flagellar protein FlbD
MIRLFRHDGLEFLLNVDLIKIIDATPTTVITLISGEKIAVKNTLSDVMTKIRAYRQGIENECRDFEEYPRIEKPVKEAIENFDSVESSDPDPRVFTSPGTSGDGRPPLKNHRS